MRKYCTVLLILIFSNANLNAQVPNFNSAVRLDVAQWNIEWFGDATNGPSNQTTQLNNAIQLIKGMNVDLMSLCEISDSIYWGKLLAALPEYTGVISTWSQTQKTALIFKNDQFKLLYAKNVLSQYEADFASGRTPLEVALERNVRGNLDTIFVWVIHLKANIGTTTQKSEAYNKRYNSSVYLKNYVNQYFRNKKGLIMGDWNDDFDKSIFNNNTSPFVNWRDDANYLVPTYQLSLKSQRTTASYTDAIDHIATTPGLKNYWVKDSVQAFYANAYIGSFSSNTSDHFPVFARFYDEIKLPSSTREIVKIKEPQFVNHKWEGSEDFLNSNIQVYNFQGVLIFEGQWSNFCPPQGFPVAIIYSHNASLNRTGWLLY